MTCRAMKICKYGSEGKQFLHECGPYGCSDVADGKCKSSNSTKSSDIKTKNVPSKRLDNF